MNQRISRVGSDLCHGNRAPRTDTLLPTTPAVMRGPASTSRRGGDAAVAPLSTTPPAAPCCDDEDDDLCPACRAVLTCSPREHVSSCAVSTAARNLVRPPRPGGTGQLAPPPNACEPSRAARTTTIPRPCLHRCATYPLRRWPAARVRGVRGPWAPSRRQARWRRARRRRRRPRRRRRRRGSCARCVRLHD